MTDNPFSEAMDDAEDEQSSGTQKRGEFDVEEYLDELGQGPKEKTIGFAVDEPTHRFYQELRDADDIDIDVSQSLRDHVEKLARRHEDVFERAMRKLEIDQEYRS